MRIVQIIGDNVATLALGEKIVWLPAHKSAMAVGEAKLSHGSGLSCDDWRANKRVDMLAKAAARHLSCGRDVLSLLAPPWLGVVVVFMLSGWCSVWWQRIRIGDSTMPMVQSSMMQC